MGKRVESVNPLRAASSPSLVGTGLPHTSSDRALSPCIAGFGSCPNSWEALPGNLHSSHVLRPPNLGRHPGRGVSSSGAPPDPESSLLSCSSRPRLTISNDRIIVCFIDHDQPSVAQ